MKRLSAFILLLAVLSVLPVRADDGSAGSAFSGGRPWIDSQIKSNITEDMPLSPKDDFHLFVNHEWLLAAEIPEGSRKWDAFDADELEIKNRVTALLNDETLTGGSAEIVQSWYRAFLDWDARNEAGLDPIADTVERIRGIGTLDELSDLICDPEGDPFLPAFITIGSRTDEAEQRRYVTVLRGPALTLVDAGEYRDRTDTGSRLYAAKLYLTKAMLTRIGYSAAEAEAMFAGMIAFEKQFAEIFPAMTGAVYEGGAPVNDVFDLSGLEELSPSYPLARFIVSRGYGGAEQYRAGQLDTEAIRLMDALYMEDNLETLRNWLLIRYVTDHADCLDRAAYDAYWEAVKIRDGFDSRKTDEDTVYDLIFAKLYTPLDRMYLERYDVSALKEKVTEICRQLIDAYRIMLRDEDWLSEETKNRAVEKLDAMTIRAVYPDQWIDYGGLDLKGRVYYDCAAELEKFERKLDASHTGGTADPGIWTNSILLSNAKYIPESNSIMICLGTLGDAFYHEGISEEEMLGTIGAIAGHEISHAFDTSGAMYDSEGRLVNWWTEADYAAFTARIGKLADYLSGMTAWEGQPIPGERNVSEALADIAGVKAGLIIAEGLEDFDYDLFFRSYAGLWRGLHTLFMENYSLMADPHPLGYLRTNVTLQQFDVFPETYDIRDGDNMYLAPEDRVGVW